MKTLKTKSFFTRILLFSLLLSVVLSEISPESQNRFCPARGQFAMEIQNYSTSDTPPTQPLSFNEVGSYYNSDNGDTVTIMLKKGDATNNYKFIHFDTDFKAKGEVECPDSANMEFITLIDKFLFMKKPGTLEFYMWRFDPVDPILKILIQLPSEFATNVNHFIPYMTDGDAAYVMITHTDGLLGSQTAIVKIIWASLITTIAALMSGNCCITGQLSQAIGNDVFVYSDVENKFKIVNTAINADGNWVDQPTLPSPVGKIVGSYRLRDRVIVLSMLEQDEKSGTLHHVKGFTPTSIVSTSSSTPYVDYSDDMSNFMRIGSSKILWVNMKNSENIYSTQLESSDLDYANIKDVGLSGNKAVFLYSNSMKYLRNTDGVITSLFVKQFTTTEMNLESNGQWKVSLSCFCALIKKSVCFSSTLNCLLVKIAQHQCFKVDDITP